MKNLVRAAASIAAMLVVVVACSGASASSPPSAASVAQASAAASVETRSTPAVTAAPPTTRPTTAPSVGSSAPAVPSAFTSMSYGYSLTLPAGWTSIQATAAWDGKGAPFHDVPEADQFVGPAAASAWFYGAPTTKDLAGRVKEMIAAQAAEHASTCPPVPEVKDPIKIGSEPGTWLGYDCGILIVNAIAVHDGHVYVFGFRDPAVHAATDPADRAAFLKILETVRFPD